MSDEATVLKEVVVKTFANRYTEERYRQVASGLLAAYPDLKAKIRLEVIPAPAYHSTVLNSIRALAVVIVVFTLLPIPSSSFVAFVKENRFAVLLGLYLVYLGVVNWLETSVFDLYCDGTLLFSKSEACRFPTAEEATALVGRYLQKRNCPCFQKTRANGWFPRFVEVLLAFHVLCVDQCGRRRTDENLRFQSHYSVTPPPDCHSSRHASPRRQPFRFRRRTWGR